MRGILYLGLFIFSVGLLKAQTLPTVTATFDKSAAEETFDNIEKQTGWRIFYKVEWVDTLSFTGQFEQTPLNEVLQTLFQPYEIQYYLSDKQVILTNNVIIIAHPQIEEAIKKQAVSPIATKGLIFSKDYQPKEGGLSEENQIYEIGDRGKFVPRATSNIVGYVKNADTEEPIEGVLVYTLSPTVTSSTDSKGFYSIGLLNGKQTLHFQFVGMRSTQRELVLFSDGRLNVNMDVDMIMLNEVIVESDRYENITEVKMGVAKLNAKETKNMPLALGENDLMKVATTLPGIQTAGEGSSGFNVRGGKSDQNLMLLDGATIYNASHFFGFFSIFNSDAIEDMDIYKSSIPAAFGGRLSSVFDISSKKPNKEKFEGIGGISPVTARLYLDVPLQKGKSGLNVAARTTYSNWVLKQTDNVNYKENRVSFSDFMARYDYQIDEKNDLTLSGYFSTDKFRLNSDTLFSFTDIQYSNLVGSAKWAHRINSQLDATFAAHYSKYNYNLEYDQSPPNAFTQDFQVQETAVDANFIYYSKNESPIAWGLGTKYYTINQGSKVPLGDESNIQPLNLQENQGLESFLYGSGEFNFGDKLTLSAGLRFSLYTALGARDVNVYDPEAPKNGSTVLDTLSFNAGEPIKTYAGIEPRISLRYALNDESSVKFSLNRTVQYLSSLSNSASLSPTDTWTLASYHIKPQISNQASIGYYRNFLDDKLEFSVEGYYKVLQNLIDFKVGGDFLLNDNLETVALQGPGKAYGVEVSLTKSGKLNGWLNYTYARTFIKLDGSFAEEQINGGQYYPTNYDKPHTVNLVANYKFTRRLSMSYNLVYSTGRPVTYPVATYDFKGNQVVHYSDRNTFRIPDYFRMDVGISIEEGHLLKKLSHAYWTFSVYNLLGRDNPYSVFFDTSGGEVQAYKLVIFGNPIPTVSFNFRF